MRNKLSKFIEDISRSILQQSCATPEHYNASLSKLEKGKYELAAEVSYEDMRRFVDGDQYKINVPQEYHIMGIPKMMMPICPSLIHRKWSLIVVNDDEKQFICSDNPVGLAWTDSASPMPPGFGLKETLVTFPISRNVAIAGCFEKYLDIPATEKNIAVINSMTIRNSQRFIFSPQKGFIWYKSEGKLADTAHLLEYLKKD